MVSVVRLCTRNNVMILRRDWLFVVQGGFDIWNCIMAAGVTSGIAFIGLVFFQQFSACI